MKMYEGYRVNPPKEYRDSGITNGPDKPDYQIVVFDDGCTIMRWLTLEHSTSIFPNWAMFEKIHYHPEYGTELREVNAK